MLSVIVLCSKAYSRHPTSGDVGAALPQNTKGDLAARWSFDRNNLDAELPVTYEQLCAYDDNCDRIKRNEQFVIPNQMALAIFQRIRSMIFDVAKKFSVDPVLLMAVIVTEHTLNVTIVDVWETDLVKTRLAHNGSLGPLNFSYGYGQIYEKAAHRAEKIVAEIEQRPVLSEVDLAQRLLTMKGALTYAAGILVNATRIYQKHGIDISKRPGILATLYNLGDAEIRASKTVKSGRDPRVNFFGWYILYNWNLFEKTLLTKNNELKISNELLEKYKIKNKKLGARFGKDLYPAFITEKSIPMFLRPERCIRIDEFDEYNYGAGLAYGSSAGQGVTHESISRDDTGKGYFEILDQALDCEGREWSLVRAQKGSVGWISHNELGADFSVDYFSRSCRKNDHLLQSCIDQIHKVAPAAKILSQDPNKENSAKIQVLGYPEIKAKPSISGYSADCMNEQTRKEIIAERQKRMQEGQKRPYRSNYYKWDQEEQVKVQKKSKREFEKHVENIKSDIKDDTGMDPVIATKESISWIKERIDLFRKDFLKLVGEKDWEDLTFNDYGDILEFGEYEYGLKKCMEAVNKKFKHITCYTSSTKILKDYYGKLNLKNIRDFKSMTELRLLRHRVSFRTARDYTKGAYAAAKRRAKFSVYDRWFKLGFDAQLSRIEKSCRPLFSKFPEVQDKYEAYLNKISKFKNEDFYDQLRPELQVMTTAIVTCDAMQSYLESKSERPDLPAIITLSLDFQLDDSFILVPEFKKHNSSQINYTYVSVKSMEILNFDEGLVKQSLSLLVGKMSDEFDREKKSFFSWRNDKKQKQNNWNSFGGLCSYDPSGTADMINKIGDLACVQMIQVLDEPNLISRVALNNNKTVGVNIDDMSNYFKVFVRPRCQFDP